MKKSLRAWVVTIFIASIPVIIWFASGQANFNSPRNTLVSISTMCALSGFSLYGWNILLSSRLKLFERLYGGLLPMYKMHDKTGSLALTLLLIHPTLLAIRYSLSSLASGYQFLKPTNSLAQFMGEVVLATMLLAVFASLYLAIKHELFIKLQIVLGVTFFLGVYHGLFVTGSDIRQSQALVAFASLWGFLCLVVILYRSFFHKSFRRQYKMRVASVKTVGGAIELNLQPVGDAPAYRPAQFVFIKIKGHPGIKSQMHPFSITSVSSQAQLSLGVKPLGDYTQSLLELKPGDDVLIEGPYGEFSQEASNFAHQIWIAGGIGITPFLSMARSAETNTDINLYYSYRDSANNFGLATLSEIIQTKPNIKLVNIDTSRQSQIDTGQVIASHNPSDIGIWLCGPPKMMQSLKSDLQSKGVPKKHIFTEEFSI